MNVDNLLRNLRREDVKTPSVDFCRTCMDNALIPNAVISRLAVPHRADITERGGLWAICDGPLHKGRLVRVDHLGQTQSADFWKERTPTTVFEDKRAGHTLIR